MWVLLHAAYQVSGVPCVGTHKAHVCYKARLDPCAFQVPCSVYLVLPSSCAYLKNRRFMLASSTLS